MKRISDTLYFYNVFPKIISACDYTLRFFFFHFYHFFLLFTSFFFLTLLSMLDSLLLLLTCEIVF